MQTTLQQQGNSILSQISQAMATNNQLLSKIADGSSSGVGSNLEKQAGNIINITIPSQGSDRANAIATRNEVLNQLSNISQRTKQKVSAQN
jgi:hypothetical protein